jgi:hypothetical protein
MPITTESNVTAANTDSGTVSMTSLERGDSQSISPRKNAPTTQPAVKTGRNTKEVRRPRIPHLKVVASAGSKS